MEVWKDIKGYEGMYQISNLGNVKSLNYNREKREKILKPSINSMGYYLVSLSKNNKRKSYHVHTLVAYNFLFKKDCNLVVDHINNNPLDNRLENLQFVTHRINLTKDRKNKSSKYTGVSYEKRVDKWRARILIESKPISLGYFINEYDAYLAYQKALSEL